MPSSIAQSQEAAWFWRLLFLNNNYHRFIMIFRMCHGSHSENL